MGKKIPNLSVLQRLHQEPQQIASSTFGRKVRQLYKWVFLVATCPRWGISVLSSEIVQVREGAWEEEEDCCLPSVPPLLQLPPALGPWLPGSRRGKQVELNCGTRRAFLRASCVDLQGLSDERVETLNMKMGLLVFQKCRLLLLSTWQEQLAWKEHLPGLVKRGSQQTKLGLVHAESFLLFH